MTAWANAIPSRDEMHEAKRIALLREAASAFTRKGFHAASLDDIAQRVSALIVTLGGDGSLIYTGGKQISIPTPKPQAIVDPTGCGDAYRAGLLHGIQMGWDWETTGRLASLMGSLKIASRGGQNHKYTRTELVNLFKQHFGSRITL